MLRILAILSLTPATLPAQTWAHAPSTSVIGFGAAMAFSSGELAVTRTGMVAGFPMPPSTNGAVIFFRRSPNGAWAEATTLTAKQAVIGDGFGTSISIDGSWMAVGAPFGAGQVTMFEKRNGRWTETGTLTNPGALGDQFGYSVALSGSVLIVGAPGADSVRGTALAYRRNAAGTWDPAGTLGRGTAAGDRLGYTIAIENDAVLIGAPGPIQLGGPAATARPGAAVVYRANAGGWTEEARLTSTDSSGALGASVAFIGGQVFVGAPLTGGGAGAVYAFTRSGNAWKQAAKITAKTPVAGSLFGQALAGNATTILVGAPMSNQLAGAVIVLGQTGGTWTEKQQIGQRVTGLGNMFGAAVAISGDHAVATGPFADFFAGSGWAYTRDAATGVWKDAGKVVDAAESMPAVATGREVKCDDGKASGFSCEQVDLLGFLPVSAIGGERGIMLNDIWGWTDEASGREFALVGRMDGTSFVEITNPSKPVYLGNLPLHQGANPNLWRDIKTYKNHAFIVSDGAGPHGVQVFDLTQLLTVRAPTTFKETTHYDKIASAHNIAINEETGYAYTIGNSAGGETCGGALHMIDIRDPKNPKFAGCFADKSTGNARTGYTHDNQCVLYKGPDTRYKGREICFNASETALGIADVTDKANPKPVSVASYPNTAYAHQGWLTDDHRYFYLNDEGDELSGTTPKTRTMVWDVTKLDEPVLAKEFLGSTSATDHNLYVRGNYMYQSNYVSGLRVIDITDPANPKETGYFDTVPYGENVPGFAGSWSNYPYFKSGTIIATSMREGLFILRHRPTQLVP